MAELHTFHFHYWLQYPKKYEVSFTATHLGEAWLLMYGHIIENNLWDTLLAINFDNID